MSFLQIIEESEERLKDEEVEEILGLVRTLLPGPPEESAGRRGGYVTWFISCRAGGGGDGSRSDVTLSLVLGSSMFYKDVVEV